MHGDKLQSKCLANYNKTRMKHLDLLIQFVLFVIQVCYSFSFHINILKSNIEGKPMIYTSVSDPFYFDTDPDPR